MFSHINYECKIEYFTSCNFVFLIKSPIINSFKVKANVSKD